MERRVGKVAERMFDALVFVVSAAVAAAVAVPVLVVVVLVLVVAVVDVNDACALFSDGIQRKTRRSGD